MAPASWSQPSTTDPSLSQYSSIYVCIYIYVNIIYHIISYHIISYHIISQHIYHILYNTILYYIILYYIKSYNIILYYIILYLPLLVGSRPQLLPGVSSIPIFVCAVACPPSAAFSRCSRLSHSGQAAHCAAAQVAQGAMPTLGEATRSSSRVPGIARSNL